ncbi:MAG: terpene cyclase/mutase family protein [Euryarchaeota archaeon]|nr:terpene cyclase/mutase family protein [Euryarchaeota archaeon]
MDSWQKQLPFDTIACLISSGNEIIKYFILHDLLDKEVEPIETLWKLPRVEKILKKQEKNGSWKYPTPKSKIRSAENYNQLETFRILGELVEKYGLNKDHKSIRRAAEYLFKFQTEEGDFRGIYGNQYATTYSPAIMELLIKAGYADDPHIEAGFRWLLSIRQDDGGWAIPIRTVGMNYRDALAKPDTIQPDKSKPFSHLVTGMVLRAFAAHPKYRKSEEAIKAGELLIKRLFKGDKYSDRRTKEYWERVSYPFWFTDIVSTLDSLSFLGFSRDIAQIDETLNWLKTRQTEEGLFELKIVRGRDKDTKYWICLAICRIFKRFYD